MASKMLEIDFLLSSSHELRRAVQMIIYNENCNLFMWKMRNSIYHIVQYVYNQLHETISLVTQHYVISLFDMAEGNMVSIPCITHAISLSWKISLYVHIHIRIWIRQNCITKEWWIKKTEGTQWWIGVLWRYKRGMGESCPNRGVVPKYSGAAHSVTIE
jgi:hypothetical protein